MNANLFRLVFNRRLGMQVPAWEGARTHQSGGGRRNRAGRCAMAGAGAILLVLAPVGVYAELPVPCGGGGGCGINPAGLPFAGSGRADFLSDGTRATINQLDPRVILNWQSFNIGAKNSVEFRQSDAGSVALNQIWQADASKIAGSLSANGQVYLINQNGILFGSGAQINVHSLIASSLNVSGALFKDGGLFNRTDMTPAFAGGGNGGIVVDVDASLTAQPGGKIMLFAPTVENRGLISAPDGQVLLAAGQKVYLRGSGDVNLRGLLVEVDGGGTAANGGRILAERGNITLMGLAVNQTGRLSATTSVRANGSIRLLARDTVEGVSPATGEPVILKTRRTGAVTLGEGSVTEIRPELSDQVTIDGNVTFSPSRVEIMGKTVRHDGTIMAPNGKVVMRTLDDPLLSYPEGTPPPRSSGGIYLGASSRIDVAGNSREEVKDGDGNIEIKDIERPMSRNEIKVELRGDELKDSPVQRDGILRGKTVTIDARKGTPLADVSRYITAIPRTVAEMTTSGGDVTIESQGDIVMQRGAVIDVSGGQVKYTDGYINTTKLVSQGAVYDISQASPDRIYDGIAGEYVRESRKWGVKQVFSSLAGMGGEFVPGYIEGKDAGSISVKGFGLALDGDLRGRAVAGVYQREAGKLPLGGKLVVSGYDGAGNTLYDESGKILGKVDIHDVTFLSGPAAAKATVTGEPLTGPLMLSTDFLVQGGFSRVAINRNGRIDVPVDLNLPAGGELTLSGQSLDISANISAPSGKIALEVRDIRGESPGTLTVRPDKVISARGSWVNDRPLTGSDASGPAMPDGGSISITSAKGLDVVLGEVDNGTLRPAVLDVTGGAWLKANGTLKKGDGGSITISSGGRLMPGAVLRGEAPGRGGTLQLTANEVLIRNGSPLETSAGLAVDPSDLSLSSRRLIVPSWMFSRLGFTNYEITANGVDQDISGSDLVIAADTAIQLRAPYLALGEDYATRPSGADIRDFSQVSVLPEQRAPVNLTLKHDDSSLSGSRLRMESGAAIEADPGATVSLSTNTGMIIDGRIDAPSGVIDLKLASTADVPFQPAQAIWLGRDSALLSRGAVRLQPDPQGLLTMGKVLPGGKVSIDAKRGYVVAEAGSVIDVSGTQANLDLPAADGKSLVSTPVAGSAGAIRLKAAEGMLLDGDLLARAGSGAPAANGTLSMILTKVDRIEGTTYPLPAGDRQIVLREGDAAAIPEGLAPGQAIPDSLNGKALLDVNKLGKGGFDRFQAKSDDQIQFQGDVVIDLKRSVVLDAPVLNVLGGKAGVSAAYVALGSSDPQFQATPAATGGEGSLTARADLIDLIGSSSLQGVKEAYLESLGDIRLRGVQASPTANNLAGSFAVADNLNLQARQVYPTTLSEFNITSDKGTVRILPNGEAAPVLSAGGKLTVTAPHIVNQGVLKAPLGEIALDATGDDGEVILDAGSRTSVSAEGQLIPYGKTQNGKDWVYDVAGNNRLIDAPPQKAVRITGAKLDLRGGADVDLSGGGDLYAYEFVPGPRGSKDALAGNDSYAIMPGLGASPAPYDAQYYKTSSLVPGDSIYLSGGAGLKEGFYTLLPARYALLPGAYLVSAKGGYQDIVPGQTYKLTNGSEVVAGKFASGSEVLDSRWSGFAISPGALARQQAQYDDRYADAFFAAKAKADEAAEPELLRDAGTLAITAGSMLRLDAALNTAPAPGGQGGAVDISATRLAVVAPGTAAGLGDGFVTLDAASLTRLGANSLLLGGTRRQTSDGQKIRVNSAQVVVANDAANVLSAPEIILVAGDRVQVKTGSVIQGKGDFSGSPRDIQIGDKAGPSVSHPEDGDGALLRVSSAAQPALTRFNTDRSSGTLDVEAEATLKGESVILDATRENTFKGTLDLAAGGTLDLGAGRISLGETSAVSDGLVFSNERLTTLNRAGELTLRSYSTLDLWGDVRLGDVDAGGTRLLDKLSIEAGGIRGYANSGKTVTIDAGEVTFSNPGAIAVAETPDGQGSLVIDADQVTLGEGAKKIQGFGQVDIAASREIIGQGKGTLDVTGDLTLTAGRLAAAKRADQSWSASGDVTLLKAAQSVDLPAAGALAARLDITGASVRMGEGSRAAGVIDLPAGKVTLTAREGDVVLADGAQINAKGLSKTFDGVPVSAPAGKVSLVSVKGNVEVRNGASIDVSGAESGGDAGTVDIRASEGTARVAAGTLKGGAVTAAGQERASRQGTFKLDVKTLDDFSALNTALNTGSMTDRQGREHATGGFTESRDLRVRSGDVTVATADTVKARDVRLTADNGKIDVRGTVDASGTKGGQIALSAQGDVTLHEGSMLDARATADAKGGKVELATTAGVMETRGTSVIDVSGQAGTGGRVALRAPRNGADVNIAALAGTIKGADAITVEAVEVYTASSINTSRINTWKSETLAFMDDANMDAIKARLGRISDPAFRVVPGVEVQSPGDLTLASDWDLSGWRFGAGNEPGVLTLRAAENLNLGSSLSDGFSSGITPAGPSWSYRLAGGADLDSADPLAILPAAQLAGGKGDVVISAGKLVRTGTGDIDIAAARNFELGKDASGINKSTAALYTAGEPAASLADFPVPTGTGVRANYPVNGGDIRIRAGNDVKGAVTHQLITEWQQRRGQTNERDGTLLSGRNTSWWINFGKFQQNVGALGGGNVSVNAGGNIDNLSVVIPTTGRLAGLANTRPDPASLVVTGGGDMNIDAGGDIRSGVFYVGKGTGMLRADGSIVAGRKVSDTNPGADDLFKDLPVHTILALGDGKFDVRADGDVRIETVLNPTVVGQDTSVTSIAKTYFFTYGPGSAATITSVAGDVTFANNLGAITAAVAAVGTRSGIPYISADFSQLIASNSPMLQVYPGSLTARALDGDIVVQDRMTLFPSPAGNLRLFANGNVKLNKTREVAASINLSDADPASLVNPLYVPASGSTPTNRRVFLTDTLARLDKLGPPVHASTPVHLQGAVAGNEPVRVIANTGDINGEFYLAKQARFYAGRDIKNIALSGQNVAQSDVTSLTAGRDIFFDTPRNAGTGAQTTNSDRISLGGPGRLEIKAGRNVDLGNSMGIMSRGNLDNPGLPARGADVTVMAGVPGRADYGSFIEKYFNPANTLTAQDYEYSVDLVAYIRKKIRLDDKLANPTEAQALQEFKRTVTAAHLDELTGYMKTLTKNDALTPDQALAAFKALTPEQQQPLIINAFYDELKAAGRAYNQIGGSAYSRGHEAIASLFPGETRGDISLLFSQIKTESGGDINLLVPGGMVNAGQTTPPAESGSRKAADDLGIVAQDAGAVRAFVKGDFAVNESRVFTLRGGDILIWSSEGNIDAGKGAKTAVSAPAPVVLTLPNGQTITKFSSVSGSGIRSILAGTGIKPGSVDLIAPKGEVNAGDAGIGAAGDLNIAALRVVGADNIQVAGTATGVPVSTAGALAGTLSGVSNLGADTGKIGEKATKDLTDQAAAPVKNAFKPSFLTVEVLGFGD